MKERHLFLTGARQVGKSMLLRRMIEAHGWRCSGFETRALLIDGQRRGFTLHARVPLDPFQNDCIACVRIAEKKSVPVLPVFEENGTAILRASLAAPEPFILMDELGRLERAAQVFCAQVLACLDSDKRVLGVLQHCDAPLMQAIREREDVRILTVTEENRDTLAEELCARNPWENE